MTADLMVYLAGGVLIGALVGAVVAGVLRQRMAYWVPGGIVLGLVLAFVGFSDRSGPGRDAQVLYDECLKGFTRSAPAGVTGGEDYCGCVAQKFETDEGGFRAAFEGLAAQGDAPVDDLQAAAMAMSSEVIARESQTCFAPVLLTICTEAQSSRRDDAAAYCACIVDSVLGVEGGLAVLVERIAALTDPGSIATESGIQAAHEACE